MTQESLSWLETHVIQAFTERSLSCLVYHFHRRNAFGNANTHTWIGAISDTRLYVRRVESQLLVKNGIIPAAQGFPVGHGLLPFLPLGSILTSLDIRKGGLVGCHESTSRSHFNAQIAERETTFHTHVTYHLPRILHEITRGTACGQLAHQVEGHVLGRHTFSQLALYANAHALGLLLQNAL